MDLGEQDELGLGKRNGDHSNYQSTSLTSEWKFNHQSVDPSCPSISTVDSSCSDLYNNPRNPQTPIEKALPMYWNQGILPSSFSHFPTDSGFINGAAKFSCFSGENFSSMLNNPFNTNEALSLYPRASRSLSDSLSPMDDQRDVKESNHEASEEDFSGDGQENSASKENGPRKRNRINQVKDMVLDQVQGASPMPIKTTKEKVLDTNKKGEQTSTTMVNAKPLGKNAKNSTDGDEEDYVHLRARRGQATNSHSLAERVRREKISERMKLLQDLVPGCSKVTGKAVMLDEIINYVQSLQRQVEFLWMKLASVNPRPDFNKGLLSKDLLQLQGGSSTDIGFSSQKIHPQLHQSQQGLMQTGISSMAINAARMPQVPNAWEDELCNIHQMNFGNAHELNGKPRDGFFDK